ncbi:ATP-binding protein [Streptomyces clavuligerus]|uniref:histidine kinase n=1 Tax=Streptomyces clavuligerus TaxID=1901 RepID=E2Q036_STRCL|nr:ATP-binding protein [Streptomyces clavuligerus]ANW18852.1 histidine kinase [Streptomyces clavuligerus]AXU13423.1 ATP-binding protein [Streptomyces clavuligerus]EFG08455.1 sensor histidine kinase [Streptomyces clavuligerus]MBY6303384.1 ATP-binding protein [Streptomyces clavuligerus]QCS06206.1 ATP-binding protein [Streptomyces clavuligerus]
MIEIPDLAIVAAGAVTATALLLLGCLLLPARRRLTRLRTDVETLRTRLAEACAEGDRAARAHTAEIVHLAHERVPAAATRAAHPHVPVPGPLDPAFAHTEFGAGMEAALQGVATAMLQERKRVDAAARAGMRGTTREIQAGLYRLQDVLRGLQQRYDDPDLSQTLYSLDHENEQSLRRAQVTAVVCGAWVGLARQDSHLVDAVTGGQSRLIGYQRVHISNHLEPGTALVSHAVEPVAIIVAELLDNALRHSSSDTSVTVSLERAHHGVAVTIDDAGVGMAVDERDYAQRMVAGSDPILLSELGDPPRMGLAAIGQLTRQFDLSVDVSSPSPFGGVRAVLLVRNHLLSHIDPAERPPSASAPHSTRPPAQPPEAAVPVPYPVPPPPGPCPPPPPVSGPYAPPGPARYPGPPETPRPTAREPRSLPAPTGPPLYPGPPDYPGGEPGSAPPGGIGVFAPRHTGPPPIGHPQGSPDAITHDPAPPPGDDLLPKRRRRVRPAPYTASIQPRPQLPTRTPEEAAAALGALQAGTAAARNAADPEGNDPR